jgi:predicted nuclease with TOPRIM domain
MGINYSAEDCTKYCPDGTTEDIAELTERINRLKANYEAATKNTENCSEEKAKLEETINKLNKDLEEYGEKLKAQETALTTFEYVKNERDALIKKVEEMEKKIKEYDPKYEYKETYINTYEYLPPEDQETEPGTLIGIIIGSVIGIIALLILGIILWRWWTRRQKHIQRIAIDEDIVD